jgi:hypothetical protein
MSSDALFGFLGVILGSLTTSVLTIYRERFTARKEAAARSEQREQGRKIALDTFQRDSILALQSAVTDMIRAVYAELDRVLLEMQTSGSWSARRWKTPTAVGWADAVLRLEMANARVFDGTLRALATELQLAAKDCVWADTLDSSKSHSDRMESLHPQFNARVTATLPGLYN